MFCIILFTAHSTVANDSAPEHALRPGFLSTFALATDQGSKLGLSKNKSIICYYNTYQVGIFSVELPVLHWLTCPFYIFCMSCIWYNSKF